jgi:hypothetical protein
MNLRTEAEILAIAGLNPLPLKADKAPFLKVGHKFLYEEFNEYERFENPNCKLIGVACGAVSENLFVFDFDCHNGEDITSILKFYGDNTYFKLLIDQKKVAIYRTPSGGYHLCCKLEQPEKNQVFARYKSKSVMIESRGQGGYVVCHPSQGYDHLRGSELTNLPTLSNDEYDFLVHRAKLCNELFDNVKQDDGKHKTNTREWTGKWDGLTPDGKYNNECFSEAIDLLVERGWNFNPKKHPTQPEISYMTRPGKDSERFVSGSINWKPNMFYCFTSSDSPFEAGTAYNAFSILSICSFNNDWKAAKDYLCERFGMQNNKFEKRINTEKVKEIKPPNPSDFPIEVFPNTWQKYITESYEYLNYNKDFTSCAMLSAFASCVGNSAKIKVKNGWQSPPIFWFAVVGAKGTMKTHPVSQAIKPLDKIDKENFDVYKNFIDEYNLLDKKEKDKARKPIFKQTIIKDATLEALVQILEFNPNGILLYKDELVGFIKSMNQYRKGSDEEFWLESFNNGSHTVNRVTRDTTRVENIFVNVIGTIQTDVLFNLVDDHSDNGLLDRFLYTKPESKIKPLSLKDMADDSISWWAGFIRDTNNLFSNHKEPYIITLTEDATNKYLYYDKQLIKIEMGDGIEEGVKGYVSKLKTYMPRFCLTLCLIDAITDGTDLVVNEDHVDRAYKIAVYFLSTARKIFSEGIDKNEVNSFVRGLEKMSKQDRISEIATRFPDMGNSEIARVIGCSRQYVISVLKKR